MITTVFAVAALAATMSTAGCGADAICGGTDYPAAAVNSTGRACFHAGQEPPAGYVRYPPGQVPQHVGDKWDEYWNTHTIDQAGNVKAA
jgi:hypothetical protein